MNKPKFKIGSLIIDEKNGPGMITQIFSEPCFSGKNSLTPGFIYEYEIDYPKIKERKRISEKRLISDEFQREMDKVKIEMKGKNNRW